MAGMLSYVCLTVATFLAVIIGAFSGIRPELFSVVGPILVIGGCAGVIMRVNGMSVEKSEDYLKIRAVAVWLPVLLGLILTTISMFTLWFGLWLAMTFAFLNMHRNKWKQNHSRATRGSLGEQ